MEEITVLNRSEIVSNPALTADLYSRYISYLDASEKTTQTYTRALRQFYNYTQANGIARPTREDILSYRQALQDEGKKPSTIQNYMVAVRLFFRWTAQEGIYPNIADHVKGAKLNREHKKDYLTSNQCKTVLTDIDRSSVKGLRDYAIVALMITGGLRTIEVSRANVEDLRTLGDSTVLYLQGKGRTERTEYVKLTPPVEKAVRDYLKTRKGAADADPLFTSTSNTNKGQRITTRSVSEIVKDHLVNAGYNSERLTAHSLRHTAVTLALLGGEEITHVQQFARHANIATTMVYAHMLDRAQNTCESSISNSIF